MGVTVIKSHRPGSGAFRTLMRSRVKMRIPARQIRHTEQNVKNAKEGRQMREIGITEVGGFRVGHAQNWEAATGCTVLL